MTSGRVADYNGRGGGFNHGNMRLFEIDLTADARGDLKALRKHEQAEAIGIKVGNQLRIRRRRTEL